MGVNVLQELSAEQMKFKAEITEDRFKYKTMFWIYHRRSMNQSFCLISAIFHQSRQVSLSGLKDAPNKGKANGNIFLFP